eukprot:6477055-Amphidinium_carterae.3
MQSFVAEGLDPRCEHGLLVRFAGVQSEGQQVQALWKAWSKGSCLRWALHRVLSSTGFEATKHLPEHLCLKRNFPLWSACWSKLGLGSSAGGVSRRALQARGATLEEIGNAEQEYWATTPALLLLLAHMSGTKRSLAGRSTCSCLLHAFVSRCCPSDSAVGAAQVMPDLICRSTCAEGVDIEGHCEHLRELLESRTGDTPQAKVSNMLLHLLPLSECAAVRAFGVEQLNGLGTAIDSNAALYGEFDYHKTSAAFVQGPKKRRRCDEHTRAWATRAMSSGQHQTHAEATRALSQVPKQTGLRWTRDELSLYRTSCHLLFRPMSGLGLVLDASRIGKPAKELLVSIVSCPATQTHAVLPVQVHMLAERASESE